MANVLGTALRDEPWQDLGFERRPRYGELVQRLRPEWRVDLEKAILKEMIAVLTAAHLLAGVITRPQIGDLVQLYVDGPGAPTDLWRTLGYTSRAEAQTHLKSTVYLYADTKPDEWPKSLMQRLQVTKVPDRKLSANLLVGVVRFGTNAHHMISVLQRPE